MRAGRWKFRTLGRYAIYAQSLPDAVKEYRRAIFGKPRLSPPNSAARIEATGEDGQKTSDNTSSSDKEKKQIEKLEDVVEEAQNILLNAKSVFPFDLFPDTITIDRQKLTIVHRAFFSSKQTVSVQHSDIKNIQAEIGPFLGSLVITSDHFINSMQTIKYLTRKDTLAIQQLVQGLLVAHREKVETSNIDDKKLMELLNRLGRGEGGERVMVPKEGSSHG